MDGIVRDLGRQPYDRLTRRSAATFSLLGRPLTPARPGFHRRGELTSRLAREASDRLDHDSRGRLPRPAIHLGRHGVSLRVGNGGGERVPEIA